MSEPTKMRAPYDDDEVRNWATRTDRAWAGPTVFRPLMHELLAYRERYGDIDAPPQPVSGDCVWLGTCDPDDLEISLDDANKTIAALRAEAATAKAEAARYRKAIVECITDQRGEADMLRAIAWALLIPKERGA